MLSSMFGALVLPLLLLGVVGCVSLSSRILARSLSVPGGLWVVFPVVTTMASLSWWSGYGFFVNVPLATFCGSLLICSVAGKRFVLWVFLFAVLVTLPPCIAYYRDATPDQIVSYGRYPFTPALYLAVLPAGIGGGVAWLISWRQAKAKGAFSGR
ncbi:MAG: hypothetical protein CBB60_001595 [Armatimonadetes bacterium Cent15-Ar3]|nr:MAG: hypothetical protein CBB60_001595 [Armatimonadetes bacterium Cent15-Ar3]